MTQEHLNDMKTRLRKYGELNLGEVDQLISTAERHLASAEQVRQMRQVLGKLEAHRRQYPDSMWESLLKDQQSNAFSYRIGEKYVTHVPAMLFEEIRQALALTPSEAEATAKTNAEAAAQVPGLTQQVVQMREALEGLLALMQKTWLYLDQAVSMGFARFTPPNATFESLKFVKSSKAALALTPSQAEQEARENAEKAALLEWWFDEANEEARERIRFERWASDSPWTAEQWIDAVSKVKETPNAK